ncbi:unnamed protein product, partial [Musa hybrid cultivar]
EKQTAVTQPPSSPKTQNPHCLQIRSLRSGVGIRRHCRRCELPHMDPPPLMPQLPEMWRFPMVAAPPPSASGPRAGRTGGDASVAGSTVTEQSGRSRGRRRRGDPPPGRAAEDESSKLESTSSGDDLTDTEAKRLKTFKSTDENDDIKTEAEASLGNSSKLADQNPQPPEAPKQDYIHVRARRGQATDSHSLAERARREKISERMKILQDLVPGCNKVIGKASVLDEIINYIQALQRQVEFLSMKLEAVNSHMDTAIEAFPPKDVSLTSHKHQMFTLFVQCLARQEYKYTSIGGLDIGVVPRTKSIVNSPSLSEGKPGNDQWASLGSLAASIMFLWAVVGRYVPLHHLEHSITKHSRRLFAFVYPYVQVTIPEFSGERMKRSDAYTYIEAYLSNSCSQNASRLKAELGKDSGSLTLSMDEHEEVTDEFEGAKLWWASVSRSPPSQSISWYPPPDSRRYYRLTFHRRHRDSVVGQYLAHVLREGREVGLRKRQRKLYTNNPSNDWYGYKRTVWSHVVFEHPSTFDTLAMDPRKKRELMDDLIAFRNGKDYYTKIGKAWKRGYLLHGPPGTGKSTMIAAIANFLDYDVYDLELTSVKNNTELRKLFIETTSKSIIVIEDIDCSLDLTGKRKRTKSKKEDEGGDDKPKLPGEKEDKEESKVTLSGLLNFIDGLWSACGGERLIIFTTNHVEKLDPALIRRGRMDKHIELSYCHFEAFMVLAKNYLDIDSHPLFDTIKGLMEEVQMTPADVAENLMTKSVKDDAVSRLEGLIQALEKARGAAAKADEGSGVDETVESE